MSTLSLNNTIPPNELLCELDSFDLSFLILTGHVKLVDNFDMLFDVMKTVKKQAMWDPEVELMSRIFKKSAKKHFAPLTKEITAAFDLSGEVSVDTKKINAAFKKYSRVGDRTWLDCEPKILQALATTQDRAGAYFNRQRNRALKKKADYTDADWNRFSAEALSDHMAAFTKEYPDRILHPEVSRLVEIAEKDVKEGLIPKHALAERLNRVKDLPEKYFDNVSDVYAGRAWTYTGVQMAQAHGVTEYQVVAQMDRRTCQVCNMLNGKTFSVQQAYEKMNKFFTTLCPQGKAETPEYCDYFSGKEGTK